MATEEYMTSQTYSASIGSTVYLVTASLGGPPDYSTDKTFAGDVTVQGDLTAPTMVGPTTFTGDLTVTGDVTVGGNDLLLGTSKSLTRGSGSPEGAVTAPIGAIYERTDGSANSTIYFKESGSGNTGWVAQGSASWDGHSTLSDVAYDDVIVQAGATRAPAANPVPQVAWLTSLEVPNFANAGGKYLDFGLQLPHGYVPGTDIGWHVHFTNPSTIADGEIVKFKLTYSAAPIWGIFGAVDTSVTATFTNDAGTRALIPAGSLTGTTIKANCHLIAGSGTITGTTFTLSSVLQGRIERDSTDTHAGDAYLLSIDAHIQKNRLGSENEYTG